MKPNKSIDDNVAVPLAYPAKEYQKPLVRELTPEETKKILCKLADAGDVEAGDMLRNLVAANPEPSFVEYVSGTSVPVSDMKQATTWSPSILRHKRCIAKKSKA